MKIYTSLKVVFNLFLILFFLNTTSCKIMIAKWYGLKRPKPETNESITKFVSSNHIDYDYLYRVKENEDLGILYKELQSINGIQVLDSNLNLLLVADSSLCHMGVRSTAKKLIQQNELIQKAKKIKNLKSIFDNQLICISSKEQACELKNLKSIIILLGVCKYIGLNKKLSDVDFIHELQNMGIRNKVSIILVNSDLH